ncbi:hypothetical protein C1H46_002675 [Malus baccata]|uniref:Uncharacterized protein n=1 Tax=Malus baccata TaxID=106549 RepID=A0A540NKS8_MALBA|nr:hypothetical protein C1H46_002675 [Malus baccata]
MGSESSQPSSPPPPPPPPPRGGEEPPKNCQVDSISLKLVDKDDNGNQKGSATWLFYEVKSCP